MTRILFGWCVAVLIFATGSSLHLTPQERAYLKAHPVLKVHNETNYPPFNFNVNGRPRGISIDYMNLLASRLGIKIHYVSGPSWSQFLRMMRSGELDVMLNIISTPQRERYLNFTEPYAETHKAIFTNDPRLGSLKRLIGHRVCVPQDFYIEHYLRAYYPGIYLETRASSFDCLRAVDRNVTEATVGSLETLSYMMDAADMNISTIRLIPDMRLSTKLRIATRKDEKVLRDILQKAMYTVSADELNAIFKRWTGHEEPLKKETTPLIPTGPKRIVKMCNNPNWAPIEFAEDGDMSRMRGIVIDILHLMEQRSNLRFVNVPTRSWSESQRFLKAGNCDMLPAAIKTKKREKYADFTRPYLVYRLAVITRNDKPFVTGIDDILDKTIARKKGSGLIQKLREIDPGVKIIETDSYEEAFQKVSEGKAFCTVATLPVASYYITKYGLKNLHIAGYLDMRYRLAMAVRKGHPDLVRDLEDALDKITLSEQNRIESKWIKGEVVESFDYRYLLYGGLAVGLLILFLVYRQRVLQKEIARRVRENMEQNQLLQEQAKLAALGEMVGVIAHQWRQPLNALGLSIQNLRYDYEDGKVDQRYIDEFVKKSKKTINFLSKTIEDFRNFFKVEATVKDFSVRDAINSTFEMQSVYLKKNDIDYEILGGDFTLKGRKSEFQQVILNLLNNAIDALIEHRPEGRKIVVTIGSGWIRFKDNGGGIPPEIIDRIFESHFTTKGEVKGTGLGLYVSRLIVERNFHGTITVESKNGETEFILEFMKGAL